MNSVKLGEKGQITLPKPIREQYSLSKGDQIKLIDLGNGVIELILLKHSTHLKPPTLSTRIDSKKSIADINQAIQEGIADKHKGLKRERN